MGPSLLNGMEKEPGPNHINIDTAPYLTFKMLQRRRVLVSGVGEFHLLEVGLLELVGYICLVDGQLLDA